MAFRICEDVGTTARKKMTPRRALKLWERHSGVCVLCHQPIDGAREDWFIEHLIALENGGSDDDDSGNLGPAHLSHKASKDAADHSTGAQAKRRKRRHIGIKDPNRKRLPGGRDSNIKIRMNGEVVDRRTGQPVRAK